MTPVFIIAEAGVNHNGERDLAFALVDVAAEAGADAVKFQTFDADKLASRDAPKARYQQDSTDPAENQWAMLKKLELPRAWHGDLQRHARARGIEFLSTAFDADSLDFLVGLDMPAVKVPSGELTNAPLLWHFAHAGKPLILSTGMATLGEVEEALAVVCHAFHADAEPAGMEEAWRCWGDPERRRALDGRVTLLHCTSQYPAPAAEINLRAMDTLAQSFGLPVGYSDHSEGLVVALAAVARGARIVEKHFTLDRSLPGPDHRASLEPAELRRLVAEIRTLEQALGSPHKAPQASEWDTRRAARQQVVAARAIAPGQTLARQDLATARCGGGLPARQLWDLVGRRASRAYAAGEPIDENGS